MQTVANHQPIVLPSTPTGPDKLTSEAQKPWRTPHLSMLKLEQTQKNFSSTEIGSSGAKAGS